MLWNIENLFGDLGGNVAKGNTFCNGIWIDRGGSRCIAFFDRIATASTTSAPSGTPTSTYTIIHPHVQEQSPRGGVGYYNYDINDNLFGPHNWGEVEESFEYKRLKELSGTLNRSLLNKCDWNNINQSPIDLCEDKINNDCREFHQTRTHVSWYNLCNMCPLFCFKVFLTIHSLRVVISFWVTSISLLRFCRRKFVKQNMISSSFVLMCVNVHCRLLFVMTHSKLRLKYYPDRPLTGK